MLYRNLMAMDGEAMIKARAPEDLALAIQGKMVCILADQNMGERRLGRQAAHDQVLSLIHI